MEFAAFLTLRHAYETDAYLRTTHEDGGVRVEGNLLIIRV